MTRPAPPTDLAIRVRGQVQGVGFRPFVWTLARAHGVTGDVLNDREGVLIHARGASAAFLEALAAEAPPLARVDAVETAPHRFERPPEGFLIAASEGVGARTRVTPDAATCPACAAEIRDPGDRRAGYAFSICTHCGPRFSILDRLPYDRAQTSMAAFPMCAACRAEYDDPADRRFHAQPVACPACGPRLWVETPGDAPGPAPDPGPDTPDPIAETARRLAAGEIVAIKGIGGFHLACDATNPEAIARLRRRKRRPAKPLALMAPLARLRAHAAPGPEEVARLESPAAPILLLARHGAPLPDGLAPGQDALGWMLPYTPLHHLLCDAFLRPLVMTSANRSGAPQVTGNAEARRDLDGIADAFLMHDRDIRRRLDDGVERITAAGPMVLRRGRGTVPGTLPLPPGFEDAPDTLATGGDLKGAICLTRTGQALLSHHLGDLDDTASFAEFRRAIADYRDLFDQDPALIAADLHPGYRSTGHARRLAADIDRPLAHAQHHHAHLAAVLGEHLWPRDGGPVVGLILDGLGLGTDGTIWGGEVLLGDYAQVDRIAHLSPAPLIGGDAANRAPWRNALARLDAAGMGPAADARFSDKPLALLRRAVAEAINTPLSSSVGRLFDAAAALLGLAPERQSFEGEAAMALEAVAARDTSGGLVAPWPMPCRDGALDPAALLAGLCDDTAPLPRRAARFHATIVAGFAAVARHQVERGAARAVVLSGGCFQNAVLLEATCAALRDLPVLVPRKVPANDGGLALGQALVAMAGALEGR